MSKMNKTKKFAKKKRLLNPNDSRLKKNEEKQKIDKEWKLIRKRDKIILVTISLKSEIKQASLCFMLAVH